MVELRMDESDDPVVCEGCGAELPAFLDRCPYCDAEEDDETLPCPSCGVEIHFDSQQCPVCSAWVTPRIERRRKGGHGLLVALLIIFVLGPLVLAALLVFRG